MNTAPCALVSMEIINNKEKNRHQIDTVFTRHTTVWSSGFQIPSHGNEFHATQDTYTIDISCIRFRWDFRKHKNVKLLIVNFVWFAPLCGTHTATICMFSQSLNILFCTAAATNYQHLFSIKLTVVNLSLRQFEKSANRQNYPWMAIHSTNENCSHVSDVIYRHYSSSRFSSYISFRLLFSYIRPFTVARVSFNLLHLVWLSFKFLFWTRLTLAFVRLNQM